MWSEAGQQARSTLLEAYEDLRDHYVWHWKQWQDTLLKLDEPARERDLYRPSVAVLRSHESKDFLGGVIASLSIPGDSTKATKIWEAIIWSGRATWWKQPSDFLPLVLSWTPCACFAIWNPRRRRTATGHRICGLMGAPTGAACRWMKLLSPFCSLTFF